MRKIRKGQTLWMVSNLEELRVIPVKVDAVDVTMGGQPADIVVRAPGTYYDHIICMGYDKLGKTLFHKKEDAIDALKKFEILMVISS